MKDLSETLAGKQYAEFFKRNGFCVALDDDSDNFSCTVFQSDEVLIAFTYQRGGGENIAVAEVGSPINPASIEERKDGWSLIGEVWKEAYKNYHAARKELPYPHKLNREQKALLFDQILSSFIDKIRNNAVSINNPKYRMES